MGVNKKYCPRCGGLNICETKDTKGIPCCKCSDCRCRFGNQEEAAGYASLLTKFSIEIKDILGNRLCLKIIKDGDSFKFYLKEGKSKVQEGSLTSEFWDNFSRLLFLEYSFHKWSETYFGMTGTDGVLWDFEASFERRHTISVHGCNSYPVYWSSILSSLLPVLDQGGFGDTFIHKLVLDKS